MPHDSNDFTCRPVPHVAVRSLRLALVVVGAIALMAAGSAFARSPEHGSGRHDSSRFLQKHAKQLGLDAETSAAIQKVIDGSRPRGEELRKQGRELHERMRTLLDQDLPDESAVMALADQIGAVDTAERKHRLGTMLKIRGLLTPEQRAQLTAQHEARRASRSAEMMARLGESCGPELESLCADAAPGRESMMCLRDHDTELSDTCRDGLQKSRRHKGKGGKQGKWAPPSDDNGQE